MHFQRGCVLAREATNRADDFLVGEVDLHVVLHVVLPRHHFVADVAPPLVAKLGHESVQITCNSRASFGPSFYGTFLH